ncbi:hypothetical protein GQ457_10G015330 [Hibiscus cannabinus]
MVQRRDIAPIIGETLGCSESQPTQRIVWGQGGACLGVAAALAVVRAAHMASVAWGEGRPRERTIEMCWGLDLSLPRGETVRSSERVGIWSDSLGACGSVGI